MKNPSKGVMRLRYMHVVVYTMLEVKSQKRDGIILAAHHREPMVTDSLVLSQG